MSGPEWTPEHPDAPAEDRPLTGADGATPRQPTAPTLTLGPNPFGAARTPGSDPRRAAQDDAEAQANLEADGLDDDADEAPAGPSRLGALVASLRAAIGHLGERWRRRAQPAVADEATEAAATPDPAADAPTEPARARRPPPWSPAAWSWETRVGMAAVLSFLILVGVLAQKRGWIGGSGKTAPIAKIGSPDKPGEGEGPKVVDAGKGSTPEAAPPLNKAPEPTANSSPPSPNLATGAPHLAGDHAKGEAPQQAPAVAATDKAVQLKGDAAKAGVEPLSPPVGEGLATLPGTGDLLASTSTANPADPPALPGSTTDVPVLPGDPAAGGSPPAPASPPEVETKVPEPAASTTPEPAAMPAVVATDPPPGTSPEAATTPAVTPAPEPPATATATATATPVPPEQPAVTEAAPLLTESPKRLEAVPVSPAATADPSQGPGWVKIPSGGKRPGASMTRDPGIAGGDDALLGTEAASRSRVADGPPIGDDAAPAVGQVGPVLHTVQPDENFWTISKQYYNSGRYYKALYQANAALVPDITKLYVGTVIRIPPPETLDRSLVAPAALGAALDGASVSRASSSSSTAKSTDPDTEMPPNRSVRPGLRRARSEPAEEVRRPSYRVKANDTLRSIARDTLSDSRRAGEIYNLNRDLLDSPKAIPAPGTSLTLPEDAVIGRRAR